ncbi:MAG: thioredoxin [Verrucomicrobiia bacterium]|jgi:putative thioredoxin
MAFELKDFEKDVIERSREIPVVVDFWAAWCGPCKMLGPVIEKMAGEAEGKWELVKINTEDHPQVALDCQIASIPDVRLFRDGKEVAEFKGFMPEEQIAEWLQKFLPSIHADRIGTAHQLAEEGKLDEALDMASEILGLEPGNGEFRLTAAAWALRIDPGGSLKLLEKVTEDSDLHDQAAAIRVLAEFMSSADQILAQSDGPKAEAFGRGLDACRSGDTEAWVDAWLEVLERKKDFGAGKLLHACKAIFRFLGPRHPVSARFYRRLTSALY